MKLATYKDGSRDGQLVVVARDLGAAHYAAGIAGRLQAALDDWNFIAPQLHDLYETLNAGKARHAFAFEARRCMAPLPRAYQWADASTCASRVASDEASLTRHTGDELLGACDDIVVRYATWGIDFEPRLAVVTGDVAMGSSPEVALEGVRLLMIANRVCLREPVPPEMAATAFGPVAVTPDELGNAWRGGRVHLALESRCNDERVGRCETAGTRFHFGQLIARLSRTRRVRAGSIVGSGGFEGCALRAEALRQGDRMRIELIGRDGASVCGAIEQRVAPAQVS
jgi:fumarylacetoacetate (FAA) hydrolase